MIRKYTFGTPLPTDAVVNSVPAEQGSLPYFNLSKGEDGSLTPLTEASPVRIQTHAPDLDNWHMVGPASQWSPPVPPVSLLGIGFAWGDNAVHINERHPVGAGG